MKWPSNRKCLAAPILFAFLAVFVLAAGAQQTKKAKPTTPATLEPPNRARASSIGLKVSNGWSIEGDGEDITAKTLGELMQKGKPTLLLFLSARDPASQANAERIDKLAEDYAKKSVTIIGLSVGRNETVHELKEVAERNDWSFPVVRDVNGVITRGLKARFTPQAMLIDADGRVKYSGPIDDCWFDARKAKNNFVRNATDALLAGKKISNPEPDVYSGGLIR